MRRPALALLTASLLLASGLAVARDTRIPEPAVTTATDLRETALHDPTALAVVTSLTTEIGPRLAGYQNGSPTTIIGPPTAGTFAQSPRLMQYAVNISSIGLSGSRPPLLPARTLM